MLTRVGWTPFQAYQYPGLAPRCQPQFTIYTVDIGIIVSGVASPFRWTVGTKGTKNINNRKSYGLLGQNVAINNTSCTVCLVHCSAFHNSGSSRMNILCEVRHYDREPLFQFCPRTKLESKLSVCLPTDCLLLWYRTSK